jgi:two-component system chemotaxis response regulator CheY
MVTPRSALYSTSKGIAAPTGIPRGEVCFFCRARDDSAPVNLSLQSHKLPTRVQTLEATFFPTTIQGGFMGLGRVLVVDDEEDIRKAVRLTLTKAGFDVVEAEDGEKAIEKIRSGDNPLMIDAVLCDIQMPKVNGIEAVAFFRQQFPAVPVIILTGHPQVKDATELMKQGVVDYLVKPISPEKLTEVVGKHAKAHVYKDKFRT